MVSTDYKPRPTGACGGASDPPYKTFTVIDANKSSNVVAFPARQAAPMAMAA